MTIVAWDGRTLAADKRSTVAGLVRTVTKIWRVNGTLVGGCGDAAFVLAVVDWLRAGADPAKYPASQRDKDDWQPVLVIDTDGRPMLYERSPFPIKYEDPFCAMGSGRDYAMAAMHLGKTAAEAVAIASLFDNGCGNGCDTLTLTE